MSCVPVRADAPLVFPAFIRFLLLLRPGRHISARTVRQSGKIGVSLQRTSKPKHMKHNDWKSRLNIVYSTNPDFRYETEEAEEAATLPKEEQPLRVGVEKKNRSGKTVTVIKGFTGREEDLNALCRLLKTKCGTGGSAKEGEILIQGDVKEKVTALLKQEGYLRTK